MSCLSSRHAATPLALGLVASSVVVAPAVIAQEEPQTIVVTGTRSENHNQYETLTPIDVVSRNALGGSSASQLVDSLAQLVPSFNVQQQPSANGQQFVRPARLRGLSPDQTLVLVNGKRFHRSSLISVRGAQAPDLSQIPSSAISRIEVLRDGASAQYGSDAIAGVINIILDESQALEGFSQYSSYYAGDGTDMQIGARGGVGVGDKGFVTGTIEWSQSDETSRTRQRPDAIAFQAAHPDLDVPNPVQHWGLPDIRAWKFALDSSIALGESADAYAFGTYQDSKGENDFNWRNPDTTGSSYNPSAAFPGFNLRNLYPTGFAPRFGQNQDDSQLVAGVRAPKNAEGLRWDLSTSYGRNRIEYFIYNTINASLGPNSPTSFGPGTLKQNEFNLNADFVYPWQVSAFEQPINVAFGGERRVETYEIGAGDLASYVVGPGAATGLAPGSNGFPGFSTDQAGDWDQTSYAAYADIEVPVMDRWTIATAARYEDFSEFGDKVTGKIATRFELTPAFALRGSWSTGFRAPTPGQLNSTSTSQGLDTVTLQLFTTGRLSPLNPVSQFFGAKALKPEESNTVSAGLTWRTDAGFSGSIDAYNIKVTDRFSQSPTFTVTPAIRQQLVAAGVPGAATFTGVSFFTNDFDTRTRGVDVIGTYSIGRVTLSGAYNNNRTRVIAGSLSADPTQKRIFEEGIPKQNLTGSATYDFGRVKLYGHVRYYGAWTDSTGNTTGNVTQRFGSVAFVDARADVELTSNLSLAVGADNLFDKYPDEATFQASRGLIYSRNSPYGTDGGRYYLRLNAVF